MSSAPLSSSRPHKLSVSHRLSPPSSSVCCFTQLSLARALTASSERDSRVKLIDVPRHHVATGRRSPLSSTTPQRRNIASSSATSSSSTLVDVKPRISPPPPTADTSREPPAVVASSHFVKKAAPSSATPAAKLVPAKRTSPVNDNRFTSSSTSSDRLDVKGKGKGRAIEPVRVDDGEEVDELASDQDDPHLDGRSKQPRCSRDDEDEEEATGDSDGQGDNLPSPNQQQQKQRGERVGDADRGGGGDDGTSSRKSKKPRTSDQTNDSGFAEAGAEGEDEEDKENDPFVRATKSTNDTLGGLKAEGQANGGEDETMEPQIPESENGDGEGEPLGSSAIEQRRNDGDTTMRVEGARNFVDGERLDESGEAQDEDELVGSLCPLPLSAHCGAPIHARFDLHM